MSNPIQTAITTAISALKAHDQHHVDYDDHDGYPGSDLQAEHLAAVAALEGLLPLKLDAIQRMHDTLVDVIDNHCIAMQSALIDADLRGHAAGLAWIHNALWGPGLLPDLDAARQMGGAQAWFDAKSAESADRRSKRVGALAATQGNAWKAPTDEQIDAVCAPGRAARWKDDGRQYDRDTVRLGLQAFLPAAPQPKEGATL